MGSWTAAVQVVARCVPGQCPCGRVSGSMPRLTAISGSTPKVVWLRVGNVSTVHIAIVLFDHVERIEVFVDYVEEAMLVMPAPGAE